jgi:hypothetical protein
MSHLCPIINSELRSRIRIVWPNRLSGSAELGLAASLRPQSELGALLAVEIAGTAIADIMPRVHIREFALGLSAASKYWRSVGRARFWLTVLFTSMVWTEEGTDAIVIRCLLPGSEKQEDGNINCLG